MLQCWGTWTQGLDLQANPLSPQSPSLAILLLSDISCRATLPNPDVVGIVLKCPSLREQSSFGNLHSTLWHYQSLFSGRRLSGQIWEPDELASLGIEPQGRDPRWCVDVEPGCTVKVGLPTTTQLALLLSTRIVHVGCPGTAADLADPFTISFLNHSYTLNSANHWLAFPLVFLPQPEQKLV